MKKTVIAFLSFVLGLVFASCTNQHFVSPDDFIYPEKEITTEEIKREIHDLKLDTFKKPNSAELHRQLSIFYRLTGTPHSRHLSIAEINIAIKLKPDESLFYMEKGLTNMARRFYSEAESAFKHAVELDPLCVEALYQLGRNEKRKYLRGMCYRGHINKAIKYYQRVIIVDPGYKNSLLNLALLNLLKRNIKEARKYALLTRCYYPDDTETHLLLGIIHLELLNFTESSRAFTKAFEVMLPQNQYLYSDISILLQREEKISFQSLTADKKREYFRKFWIDLDPTPTTSINERLLEHYKRVFLSCYLFVNKRLGFKGPETSRGKVLVSYGLPDEINKVISRNRLVDGPLISWTYSFSGHSFRLVFQDEFLNGNYHIPIDSFYIHYAIQDVAIISVLKNLYQYPIDFESFSILSEFVQLKGKDEKTSLLISVGLPDSIFSTEDDKYKLSYTVMDNNKKRILEDHTFFTPDTLEKINKYNTTFSVIHHSVDLVPRMLDNALFISCSSADGKKRNHTKKEFKFIDFSGHILMTSDLALSACDGNSQCWIWPDPVQTYKTGVCLCLAYEIYNLKTDSSNKTEYKVTYSINPVLEDSQPDDLLDFISSVIKKIRGKGNKQTSFIANSILQSSYGNFITRKLKIDTTSLIPGDYQITLTIVDMLSNEKTQTKRAFKISKN